MKQKKLGSEMTSMRISAPNGIILHMSTNKEKIKYHFITFDKYNFDFLV